MFAPRRGVASSPISHSQTGEKNAQQCRRNGAFRYFWENLGRDLEATPRSRVLIPTVLEAVPRLLLHHGKLSETDKRVVT